MIRNIYDDIDGKLHELDLIPAREYFDFENIPDSLADKSYFLSVPQLENGDFAGASSRTQIFNLKGRFKINFCRKLTADKIGDFIISAVEMVEGIIKKILSLTTGTDEKDRIFFSDSISVMRNGYMVFEINFNFNYRITNLI